MQTHRPVMCPSPPPRLGVSRSPTLAECRVVRRGGVCGVAARPSAGRAGRGGGAERRGQERVA